VLSTCMIGELAAPLLLLERFPMRRAAMDFRFLPIAPFSSTNH
jgi:hypothetical protein